MIFRQISVFVIVALSFSGLAHAAPDGSSSIRPDPSGPAGQARAVAYRDYVKSQADTLVGMTKVLAKAIRHGDVDTAQSTYAPAHRFLKRIEPIARALRDINLRMDARADAYDRKEVDSAFSGFHRIEYGLFANRSTAGLMDYADRLETDAREMRERLSLLELTPTVLANGVVDTLKEVAAKDLVGEEERYSKTDLWDLEANIEGVQQAVELLKSQARDGNVKTLARTAVYFAEINQLIEKHKAGCGFKNFDELAESEKVELKRPVAALAEDLATLRGTLAMD